MFRFISPLKIPLFTDQSRPRKLQITRLARKGKTRSFRYSSSPNGNRLCWISIGLPFRPPYWMYSPGTGDGKETTQGGNCTIRYPPHHGGTPGEARPKRVAQTALWSCRTVATGGRTAMRQRPPRAGTFVPVFRTKLPRNRGPGGVATMGRPHPYQNGCDLSIGANHRRSFRPFWIAPKGARRPPAAKFLQIKRHGTKPAGGGKPLPYEGTGPI